MRVLAIDTALSACSVAVVDTADEDAPAFALSTPMARGHAEALAPLVKRALDASGGLDRVERVAVTVGPGSFTGLRVGLACARAIGLGAEIPVVGVSTLSALAAQLIVESDGAEAVAAAIDARHGRVFFQSFAADARPRGPARLIDVREAARAIGGGPALVVGSGADAVIATARQPSIRRADPACDAPDPVWVARLGAASDPDQSPPRPLYLKAADAHPQQRGRIARA